MRHPILPIVGAVLALWACAAPEDSQPELGESRSELFGYVPARRSLPPIDTSFSDEQQDKPRWAAAARTPESDPRAFAEDARTPWDGVPARAPLPADAPGDPCRGRCGGDRFCEGLCFAGDPLIRADGEDACLACGRETGFRGRPDLRLAERRTDDALLDWDPVTGAHGYVVHGVRWRADRTDSVISYELPTRETELWVEVEPAFTYMFYVVAWDADQKYHSAPSNPVLVEPLPQ